MMIRKAEKAGAWYPDEPPVLREWIDAFLKDCPSADTEHRHCGAIVPHAGLAYSGLTAATAYKNLMRRQIDTVVILGAVHTMHLAAPSVWDDGIWQTPLGDLPVNAKLAAAIIAKTACLCDKRPHFGDNAIELQLPFVKFCFPNAHIVPIAVPPSEGSAAFGTALAAVIDPSTTILIASSDFTHYGASFGLMPAGTGYKAIEWVHTNDGRLIDCVLALKSGEVVEEAETHHSACGAGAIAALTAFAAEKNWKPRLLQYCTSNDIQPETPARHMVGYASILFSE